MSEWMTKLEKVINGLEHCTREVTDAFVNECSMCPYKPTNDDEKDCVGRTQKDALELLKKQEAVKPNRGLLDNYYCGICGSMITASIKIFDGERYMIGHPDHLKPEHKWKYCKNCGTAVRWE